MSQARRKTIAVKVGRVTVGGPAPIVVQSMTNTDTADIEGTAQQIKALARAGSELVRITVNEASAAAAVAPIRDRLAQLGVGRSHHRRLSFQRAQAAARTSRVRGSAWPNTASTLATSGAAASVIRNSPR